MIKVRIPSNPDPVFRPMGYLQQGEVIRYRTWFTHGGIPARTECWASRPRPCVLRFEADDGTIVDVDGTKYCLISIERAMEWVEEEDLRVFQMLDDIAEGRYGNV